MPDVSIYFTHHNVPVNRLSVENFIRTQEADSWQEQTWNVQDDRGTLNPICEHSSCL